MVQKVIFDGTTLSDASNRRPLLQEDRVGVAVNLHDLLQRLIRGTFRHLHAIGSHGINPTTLGSPTTTWLHLRERRFRTNKNVLGETERNWSRSDRDRFKPTTLQEVDSVSKTI